MPSRPASVRRGESEGPTADGGAFVAFGVALPSGRRPSVLGNCEGAARGLALLCSAITVFEKAVFAFPVAGCPTASESGFAHAPAGTLGSWMAKAGTAAQPQGQRPPPPPRAVSSLAYLLRLAEPGRGAASSPSLGLRLVSVSCRRPPLSIVGRRVDMTAVDDSPLTTICTACAPRGRLALPRPVGS